ncbi:hypothetical protein BDA96_04G002000 [Sorghum bicolor]|jgi:glutaredoxin domain-containing cysteine-rich protein 1|uniref:Glutaredoxin domain-containing protein n=2 Tax=Sorghum bicolor TaxID=4558 RepID=A0A921R051_SORBI|nr:uncharacterized protein At5g39865 [Sorghum bicolor]KAG0531182.1 hypothetical protein BDA96_04G002000 [Sorghum bicolor]KXG29248.1 hypothetical protein SORBI_3004G001800 [Sorghum bicolor]|eukprot:XP_021314630.1 uncharacterized protein At5g39865 [Sorghum bicolor]
MGCVSSSLLEGDGAEDDRRRIISHHHIVSLTSSTYGILTSPRAYSSSSSSSSFTAKPVALGPEPFAPPPTTRCAPPPPPPPPLPPPARQQAPPPPKPESQPQAEVINSWELMAGLVDPSTPAKPTTPSSGRDHQRRRRIPLRAIDGNSSAFKASPCSSSPSAVVLYTTSLRGVRATFEACNAVRAVLQAHGVAFRERDVSMDRGFRDELRSKVCGARAPALAAMLPRLFVRGRHVGGAEDVLRLDEEGLLAPLLEGLPRARGGGAYCCDGCGGMRFLPCFDCSGSRKLAVTLPVPAASTASCSYRRRKVVVVRCGECNENGLVLCPICS